MLFLINEELATIYEIDRLKFQKTSTWCVYLHKLPNGSVFYVGKGTRHRARAFAARSKFHKRIVKKWGRNNIGIEIIPCSSEVEAFELEKSHIAIQKALGAKLCNFTDGGEGISGWKHPEDVKARIGASNKIANKNWWKKSSEEERRKYIEASEKGGQQARIAYFNRPLREFICKKCNKEFLARHHTTKFCSEECKKSSKKKVREYSKRWQNFPEETKQKILENFAKASKKEKKLISCAYCKNEFFSASPKAIFCSTKCNRRFRRNVC